MNNDKGKFEMECFGHLGFVFKYNGKSISEGIKKHRKGQLTASQVHNYGLQEKEQYCGLKPMKLLYPLPCVVKQIFDVNGRFGVTSYTDPKLWGATGPICDKVSSVNPTCLKKAIESRLNPCKSPWKGALQEGNSGHDFMRERIEECVKALVSCLYK